MLTCPRELVRAIGLPLMCLALFSLAGGHWAVLQTIAWAQMLQDYSRGTTLTFALKKTFSGKYPCGLCRQVQEGRQKQENAPATVKVEKKAEVFLFADGVIAKAPPMRDASYPLALELALPFRSDPPPSPVPILHAS